MEKYYFTFGSDEGFPYQNTYLIVMAASYADATMTFREKYPDREGHANILNCSDYYSESLWNERIEKYYSGKKPADIIFSRNCYGPAPEGYDDVFVYVPSAGQIVEISEGNGCNLIDEDADEGIVDYIYYDQVGLKAGMPVVNGGMIVMEQLVRERYERLSDCIPDVLEMAYGDKMIDAVILSGSKKEED